MRRVILLAFAFSASWCFSDVLHMSGGAQIVVEDWWEEGGRIYYQTDAGIVGIPRADILRIDEDSEATAPSYRLPPSTNETSQAAEKKQLVPQEKTPEINLGESADGKSTQPRKINLGELTRTIEHLEIELRRAGSDDLRDRLNAGLADLHVLKARQLYQTGDKLAAQGAYERALGYAFDHLFARIELGWLELREGNPRRARDIVDTGLATHPQDGHLLELRGECYYRDNRLPDALQSYREALLARPGEKRLQQRIEKIQRDLEAERGYRRADSQNFVLRYDGERDEQLGVLLIEVLEDAWDDLTRELDAHPNEPVTVIVYTRREFHETTRTPAEVAGLFDGKIRLPMGGVSRVTPALQRVARHELVHALLYSRGHGQLPRWLHEGFAQRLEPRSHETVRSALLLARERGLTLDIEPFSYPTALSFVTFLDESYSRSRLLWLVEELAKTGSEDQAFREAYRTSRKELIREWGKWLSDPP